MVTGSGVSTSGAQADTATRRPTENRRSNKPIMEKRRRARINNCLNELKSLILDAMKKDPARHSKLEKADILEMTVKHLEAMQRQHAALAAAADPQVLNKFHAGYNECASEVRRYPGIESTLRRRLLQYLANCLNSLNFSSETAAAPTPATVPQDTQPAAQLTGLQVHILPAVDAQLATHNGIFFSTGPNTAGLQLVPTRLPNGDIALVLPSSSAQILRQVSTPSTSPSSSVSSSSSSASSASSSSVAFERLTVSTSTNTPTLLQNTYPSCTSPSTSTASCDMSDHCSVRSYSPPMQAPLSLVVKKDNAMLEDMPPGQTPWRPW